MKGVNYKRKLRKGGNVEVVQLAAGDKIEFFVGSKKGVFVAKQLFSAWDRSCPIIILRSSKVVQ